MHVTIPIETHSAKGETEALVDTRSPSWELAKLEVSTFVLGLEQPLSPNAAILRPSPLEGGAKILRWEELHTQSH